MVHLCFRTHKHVENLLIAMWKTGGDAVDKSVVINRAVKVL